MGGEHEPFDPSDAVEGDPGLRDLDASLRALSTLSVGADLETTLTRVAALAVQAIPGADGAGLTLLQPDRPDTVVATAPFVREVDDIQYAIGHGPCISAAADGTTVMSGSLGADPRWTGFGSRVARLGVHSVVSLPLLTPEGVLGAMNVYAHAQHSFDSRAARLGELFAAPAAIAVQNAQVLARTRRLATRLQDLLDERVQVERAVGMLMSRDGVSPTAAHARLRRLSQDSGRPLVETAASVVDDAVRRAGGRHEA